MSVRDLRGARICFVADGRSPIARNWIRHFVERGYDAHLVSTFSCDVSDLGLASVNVVPVAFAGRAGGAGQAAGDAPTRPGTARRIAAGARTALLPAVLGWVAPFELSRHVGRLRAIVDRVDPDLVHAMRVPYEGILAACAVEGTARSLVTSIWGNDLELWATRYPLLGRLTRRTLARTTALHPDCERDLRLAREWGWDDARPAVVIPTNGGVRTDVFRPGPPDADVLARYALPASAPVVLNARGVRPYVRNDTFFRAIPIVLERRPDVIFAGVAMRGHPTALRWVRELGIDASVRLLPSVRPAEMAALFRGAAVAVSPTVHDGTPNTLLEAMACGAFPVAGDIASVREWVEDGRNGLLVDPKNPRALAAAVLRALEDAPLRASAAAANRTLIETRADYAGGMRRAEALYSDALVAARRAAHVAGGRAPALAPAVAAH